MAAKKEIHIDIDSHNTITRPRGGKNLWQKTVDDMERQKRAPAPARKRAKNPQPARSVFSRENVRARIEREITEAIGRASASKTREQRQAYVSYAQGMVEGGTICGAFTSAQNALWMDRLRKVAEV